jgi:hypothetical protein
MLFGGTSIGAALGVFVIAENNITEADCQDRVDSAYREGRDCDTVFMHVLQIEDGRWYQQCRQHIIDSLREAWGMDTSTLLLYAMNHLASANCAAGMLSSVHMDQTTKTFAMAVLKVILSPPKRKWLRVSRT